MTNRYLIAAAFLCALPFGLLGAAPLGDPPKQTDPPAPDSADAKKRKAEQEELKARDLKKLQGKWVVVREVIAGTLQEGDRGHRIFKDNTLRVNRVTEGTFTADTSVRPKCLTLTYTDEKQRKARSRTFTVSTTTTCCWAGASRTSTRTGRSPILLTPRPSCASNARRTDVQQDR